MEKDPKQVNPQAESANTYPGQREAVKVQPETVDLLPSVFRTDTNKKIFGAAVEDLFQPSAIENVNFQVGRPSSSADIAQEFLPKANARRQLESGLLVEDSTGTRVLTADDIALAQGHANDHLAEPQVPVSVLDLPIDADKFLNWSNYYWAEEGMPVLYVSGPKLDSDEPAFDVERDILGKRYFTLPTQVNGKKLEFKNGMRIVFQKSAVGCKTITGDTQETHIADGTRQIDFQHEMTQQYKKASIIVTVDGELRQNGTHFRYTRGSLIWNDDSIPAAGAVVEFTMPDYWLTVERDARDLDFVPNNYPFIDRRWRVEGVGTPAGIKLLPKTQQTTTTVYSSSLPSQWDRVNIPWDRIEWDAELLGINQKHYSLMGIGAENRAAHSRVNAWIHKDTIKTVADYLDVDTTTDIIPADRVALRPIIEFDANLELFDHGTRFRHWVDAVVNTNINDPNGLRNTDVVYLLVATTLGTIRNFTDASTGVTLYERIANAIRNSDDDDLSLAIRGLEPRLVIIDTISKIKTLIGYLTRGIEKSTFNYSVDATSFSAAPVDGKVKFDSTNLVAGSDVVLSINASDLDGNQNGSNLEKVYNENFLKCYFRAYDPTNTSSYALVEMSSAPRIFGRTTRLVDLYDAVGGAVEESLPTGTLLELVEDQGTWFLVRKVGSTTDKWIRGGVIKDHYLISGQVIRSTVTNFSEGQALAMAFVRVEYNPQRIERISQRVLWLADGDYKNKIVTFTTNVPYDVAHDYPSVSNVLVESAQDGDAVVVSTSGGALSCYEFHWVNGACVSAQTRANTTDVTKFRIYDRDGIALDQWVDIVGYKPNRLYSTILEFDADSEVDTESGYKIKFLPSQFRQLDPAIPAANAFYDVQFQHTLQDNTTYFVNSTGEDRTVPGPYNFRRLTSPLLGDADLSLEQGMSSGYRRAWFRLRSWTSNTYDISSLSVDAEKNRLLALPADAWPRYGWYIGFHQGKPTVMHSDNYQPVADNVMVGGRGEIVYLETSGADSIAVVDHYSGDTILSTTVDANGHCQLQIPNDISTGFYDVIINDTHVIKFMVLDPKFDPRSPKVLVNGLPVSYAYEIERDTDNNATLVQMKVSAASGTVEIQHQGSFTADSDHATSLPGLEYNPTQNLNLGILTPSRLAQGLKKSIEVNSLDGQQPWQETARIFALDGCLMADTSSQRAQWALHRLEPNLSEALASRSIAAWRWYRRFVALINRYNDENDLTTQSPRYWLDRILTDLTVGMNYSVPDAVSGMALSTDSMNSAEYTTNGSASQFDIYTAGSTVYQGIYGSDHIYVYVNDQQWMRGERYDIDGTEYSFQLSNGLDKISFSPTLPPNTNVKIFHATEESVYSGIPASPAKLGLGGVFKPKIVRETWGSFDRLLIQKHDGSRTRTFQIHTYSEPDLRDQIVLELEYRIWAGCVNRVGEADRQRLMLLPPAGTPISEGRAQAALEWFSNNDVDFRARVDYNIENPWTYNYGGKSWRAIYLEAFGTVSPHTHPWEMLGFDEEPTWWSTHYDWVDTNKRLALEQALTSGLISQPGAPETHDPRVRRQHPLGFPISEAGELLSPDEWGYPVPAGNGAAAPWDLGSLGPQEEVWIRSSAGIWARALDIVGDIRQVDRFVETGITPFVEPTHTNSPAPIGVLTQAPSSFVQARPTIGIGAVLFEAYREVNLLGESPILELGLVQSVLQFGMGGFSDATARFRMYHAKYQNSNYVPEEDYSLVINPSVATSRIRFSAVRVELDGNGYRVYGYDHQYRYFEIATPVKTGPSGGQASYQRVITTPNGDFIRYLRWDITPTRIEYGTYFSTKQELFDFFIGLEELQKTQGLLFDQLNDRGTIDDWQQAALDAMAWVSENWGSDIYVTVSPVSSSQGFRFYHEQGQLERLDAEQLRRGKILFFTGRLAQNKDLFVTRDIEPNVDFIQSLDQQQIVFADLRLRNFDHVYYFNSFTRLGDLLIDKQANIRINYLTMVGRRGRGWTGRTQAQGMIPTYRGLLPGFDAVISDIVEARRPEKSQFDTFKGSLSKSNVVPLKTSVLNEIILDPAVSFQYRQGLQAASGTNLAIDALFRNRQFDIPGRTQDLNINEQWLFNDGDFGRLNDRKVWEILVKRSDLTSKRQAFRFSDGNYITGDSRSDTVIDIVGPRDPRWITRDFIDPDFGMIPRDGIDSALTSQQGWLPSAGVTNLLTSDIKARDIDSLLTVGLDNDKMQRLLEIRSFSRFANYLPGDLAWYQGQLYQCLENIFGGANTAWDHTQWAIYTEEEALNSPPTIWVSDYAQRDSDGRVIDYGWNLLQFVSPLYVEEICPNALDTGLNESKVTFGSPHGFKTNDVIFITGSGDGNYDGLHRVIKRVDDYNLLIAARSTGDVVVYNLVAFKITPTKFRSLAELETALPPTSSIREGMMAYVEPDGTPEGEYLVYMFDASQWVENPTLSTVSKSMVDSHSIEKVVLIDAETEEVLANLEVYDPYKGLIVDEVGQYINYKTSSDPAVYNLNDLGLPDLDAVELWGAGQLGKIWWDTSRVRYIEYEQSDLKYRVQNWGKQFADSEVQIFEWTRSTTLPTIDEEPNIRLDYSSGTGVPRYSVIEEEDPISGAVTVYYYFWKRGVDTLPTNSTRKYSAQDIEYVLQDPDAAGVSWFSPVYGPGSSAEASKQFNAFLISNIDAYMSTRNEVILRIVQKYQPEQQHSNALLVSEGFTGDVIPEYLYRRMKSSVVGRDHYRKNYEVKSWQPNTAYNKGDYVINWAYSRLVNIDRDGEYQPRDIPIILEFDGGRETVKEVLRPVLPLYEDPPYETSRPADDPVYRERLHQIMLVRSDGYTSSNSFLEDFTAEKIVLSAASALVKRGLDIPGYRACVIINRRVPDPRLHPLRRYGNAYVPVPQTWYADIREARRNLLKAANAYLLKVNAVAKNDWNKHLQEYKPLFGAPLSYDPVEYLDLTPYWYRVDYATADYVAGSEQYLVTDLNAVYADERDGIFGIADASGIIQESYLKSGSQVDLIYQRDGTIQIEEDIWIDAWDSSRWNRYRYDEDNAEVFESIITALREDIFTGADQGYFNLLFFDMVKESLRQVPNADWVSKTTYLDIAQSSNNDLREVALYFDRQDIQVKEYINEVKPYHSKIVNINQDLSTNEEFSATFGERLVMTTVRNTEVIARDYFLDLPEGDPLDPALETQAMFQPTRSGRSVPDSESENPVAWTQSPLLTNNQEMMEIIDPDRRAPTVVYYKDPDSFDIDDLT